MHAVRKVRREAARWLSREAGFRVRPAAAYRAVRRVRTGARFRCSGSRCRGGARGCSARRHLGAAVVLRGDAEFPGRLPELPEQVLPFAHPQVVQVLAAAHAAER